MAEAQPTAEQLSGASAAVPLTGLTWAAARQRLVEAETYLLATVRPDARPHVVPVLAVWLDGALHFNTGKTARKAKNLAANPHCAITVPGGDLDLVVEGVAVKVGDEARLRQVADGFPTKYPWWHPTVRDGVFHADDAGDPRDDFAVASIAGDSSTPRTGCPRSARGRRIRPVPQPSSRIDAPSGTVACTIDGSP